MAVKYPKDANPEKFMILLFPLITLSLFIGAIILLWAINVLIIPMFFT